MKLKDLADIKVGLPLVRNKAKDYDDIKISYKLVSLKSFSINGILIKSEVDEFFSKKKIDKRYITQIGDILVRLRTPSIAISINKEDSGLLFSSLIAVIRPKKEVNSMYLTHVLNSKQVQRQLQKKSKGTTIPMVMVEDLKNLDIPDLPLEKQKKIELMIALANKEINLLEELIKLKTEFKNKSLDNILKGEI